MSEMAMYWVAIGAFLIVLFGFMTFIFPNLIAKKKHR